MDVLTSVIHFCSTIETWPHDARMAALFTGQCITALGQSFSMYAPAKTASTWFPENQRTLATTFGAVGKLWKYSRCHTTFLILCACFKSNVLSVEIQNFANCKCELDCRQKRLALLFAPSFDLLQTRFCSVVPVSFQFHNRGNANGIASKPTRERASSGSDKVRRPRHHIDIKPLNLYITKRPETSGCDNKRYLV